MRFQKAAHLQVLQQGVELAAVVRVLVAPRRRLDQRRRLTGQCIHRRLEPLALLRNDTETTMRTGSCRV